MPDGNKSGPIHVALTFNDAFWAPAYATMRSICLTTRRRGDLVFHLIHTRLTTGHAADLDKITEEFGARLEHYELETLKVYQRAIERLRYHPRLSHLTYARFFIDHLLDPDIKRVIYIDCDFLVLAPIDELAEVDLEGRPIGAALCALILWRRRSLLAGRSAA